MSTPSDIPPPKHHSHGPFNGDNVSIPRWVVAVACRLLLLAVTAFVAVTLFGIFGLAVLWNGQLQNAKTLENTAKKIDDASDKVETLDASVKKVQSYTKRMSQQPQQPGPSP